MTEAEFMMLTASQIVLNPENILMAFKYLSFEDAVYLVLYCHELPTSFEALLYSLYGVLYLITSIIALYYIIILKPITMGLGFLIDRFVTIPRFVSAY